MGVLQLVLIAYIMSVNISGILVISFINNVFPSVNDWNMWVSIGLVGGFIHE